MATNPKEGNGNKKVGLHVIPPSILLQTALALTEGEIRYSGYNWRSTPVRAGTYYDSTLRHLMSWFEGQDNDPDSNLPHIIKAIAGLIVLADAIQQERFIDDRPKKHIDPDWMNKMNIAHNELVERVTAKMKGVP